LTDVLLGKGIKAQDENLFVSVDQRGINNDDSSQTCYLLYLYMIYLALAISVFFI
jgi:hypothetical protein